MNSSDWLLAHDIVPYDDLIIALEDALEEQRQMCAKNAKQAAIDYSHHGLCHIKVYEACLNTRDEAIKTLPSTMPIGQLVEKGLWPWLEGNYLLCDGSKVDANMYPDLAALLAPSGRLPKLNEPGQIQYRVKADDQPDKE